MKIFDRDLLKEIFSEINQEKKAAISKDKFIRGYIEIENRLEELQKEIIVLIDEKNQEIYQI